LIVAVQAPADIHQDLLAAIPNLRAFAISLCGDVTKANDLVQETMLKAWANRDKFTPGTNFKAWLFTILRNTYFSDLRRARREIQDVDGQHAALMSSPPEQNGHLDLKDFARALDQISPDQREALILVGAEGFSYEEAAVVCGCAVGTVKSRVNRARNKIAEIMAITSISDIGPGALTPAVPVPVRGSLD
jgi:RNA polymerase sigma-70 factor, ECF subfamily